MNVLKITCRVDRYIDRKDPPTIMDLWLGIQTATRPPRVHTRKVKVQRNKMWAVTSLEASHLHAIACAKRAFIADKRNKRCTRCAHRIFSPPSHRPAIFSRKYLHFSTIETVIILMKTTDGWIKCKKRKSTSIFALYSEYTEISHFSIDILLYRN